MPRYKCLKGCVWEAGTRWAGDPKWHNRPEDCPKESVYVDPATRPAPATPPPPKPGTPEPAPRAPGTSGLTSSGRPAEVVKTSPLSLVKKVEQDYILDGPHVKVLWNVSLGGFYQLHEIEAKWFEMAPLSPAQFKLSALAEMTLEADPRNFYARVGTWVCKRAGCKTLPQAQTFVATVEFGAGFGGLFVAVVLWHMKAVKESPKMKRRAAEKATRAALAAARKRGPIDTTGVAVP